MLKYFKKRLLQEKCSTKYFNRAFLETFLAEYAESKRIGHAQYPDTMQSRFYTLNSCAYCVFLELHYEYEKALSRSA